MQTDEITEQSTDPITLDEVIGRIVSGRFTHQENLTMLNKLTTQQLTSYTLDGLDPLTVINPATFSLAYLYFITARCLEATENNGLHLFQMLHHFIQVFEVEQVQLAPSRFSLVGKALLYLTEVMQKPLLPLQTFKLAINRFSNNNLHELTSLHAPFLQACILAKAYRFPLDILTQDIEIIDPKKNDIDIQGFLEYFYYGAIIYIGNKRFGDALDSLSIVISAPIQKAISAIQIAAYKKYVLVSLIWDGRLRALPKYTAQGVEKMCKMQATPYINLVKAFHDTSIEKFQEIVNKSSVFEDDQHIGLVKQCFEALRRKKIKELTRVYITVELKEMAEKIGDMTIEELELILIDMVVSYIAIIKWNFLLTRTI
ncbi:uncharacterized protein BX663DRAFT_442849 [Cokeromyces recurvatus]|uniref:uncharacterized protein n=1 Tax=Cokeromyces recurvatus TaxID=90255 RepID=UPI002220D331|nr:uncharacterized protein BX663DRAFT_442849 [Cokeromyces recurvatus]KAI7898522.1 hypothetical protein BX663DRAFT_442849 [Cokeromyces recurvatus]